MFQDSPIIAKGDTEPEDGGNRDGHNRNTSPEKGIRITLASSVRKLLTILGGLLAPNGHVSRVGLDGINALNRAAKSGQIEITSSPLPNRAAKHQSLLARLFDGLTRLDEDQILPEVFRTFQSAIWDLTEAVAERADFRDVAVVGVQLTVGVDDVDYLLGSVRLGDEDERDEEEAEGDARTEFGQKVHYFFTNSILTSILNINQV